MESTVEIETADLIDVWTRQTCPGSRARRETYRHVRVLLVYEIYDLSNKVTLVNFNRELQPAQHPDPTCCQFSLKWQVCVKHELQSQATNWTKHPAGSKQEQRLERRKSPSAILPLPRSIRERKEREKLSYRRAKQTQSGENTTASAVSCRQPKLSLDRKKTWRGRYLGGLIIPPESACLAF